MRIAHFFEGSLGREEVASALLAMGLDSIPRFRRYFFQLVLPGEYASLSRKQWSIKVEMRQVDVRMESDDTIVLIENKVNAGAKQKNQLLRYYLRERKHNQEARVILVYLAPGQIGKDEISSVADSSEFQANPSDLVKHLSWETLTEYVPQSGDILDGIVRKGLDEIQRIIAEARQQKYICEGDRTIIRDIMKKVRGLLEEQTNVHLKTWSESYEEIYTSGTNLTISIRVMFELEKEIPFAPINMRNEHGLFQITILSKFKLEGKVKKSSELAKWWGQQIQPKFIKIPGVGKHILQADGWLVHDQAISGSEKSIEKAILDTGSAVLGTLSLMLSSAGFKLSKP